MSQLGALVSLFFIAAAVVTSCDNPAPQQHGSADGAIVVLAD